ncbi:hypothetical protein D3C87_2023970 [compost metagenome]
MRNHDNQLILCYGFDQLHDLLTGFRIQRPRRLIRENNIRIVGQGTGNRYPLHLSAGELVRLFMDMLLKSDLLQDFKRLAVFLP